jgi:hypothetical protein
MTQQVTLENRPTLNAVVDHDDRYGIYKDMRRVDGAVCCILVDPHTPGYRDPAVSGHRYAIPIEQCRWTPGLPIRAVELERGLAGPVQPWVTPGKPEWWQRFEEMLIAATTWAQLQAMKTKGSKTYVSPPRRRQVMALWQCDGRYEWLQGKAARLRGDVEGSEQQTLVEQ